MFLHEKWGTLQSPWKHISCIVVVPLTNISCVVVPLVTLLIFLDIRAEPVHPLLAALFGIFCFLTHFLHQAASLSGGRIALDIVWAGHLSGWGLLFRFAKTKTNKWLKANATALVICKS